MSGERKQDPLKKMSLIELKEVLERENILLKNRNLLNKLADKGKSIEKFRDHVEEAIADREKIESVEDLFSNLRLSDEPKHNLRICKIERTPDKERYKPSATLNRTQIVKPDSKIFKIMEDCSQTSHPTKLLPLLESLTILKRQEQRVKEEQIRTQYNRMLTETEQTEETNSDLSDSEASDDNESFEPKND